jgi:hypothetical protein
MLEGRLRTRMVRLLPVWALLAVMLSAPGQAAARPDGGAILTPVAMEVLDAPIPVRGADDRKHLAYEVTIANHSALDITIDRVQARANGEPFGEPLAGADFAEHLRVFGHDGETTIPAGGNAVLFFDLRYGIGAPDPERLTHLWRLTTADPAAMSPDEKISFIGVRTKVSRERPLIIESPLGGRRWLNANGCCMPIGGHRGGTLAVDGTLRVGERYAIDFVGLDAEHRLFDGPLGDLSSYGFFGVPVRSATAGRVVEVLDGETEQVPGILPTDLTLPQYGGNFVTVRVDRHHFAFYAHLRPGRIAVEVGDRVRPGQKLGQLGNTGNSNAPHLHFQMMDGRSPLQSNGLPFVFSRFTGEGYVPDLAGMPEGEPLAVDGRLAGPMRRRMPIAQQLLGL